jgi:hypothetical protein
MKRKVTCLFTIFLLVFAGLLTGCGIRGYDYDPHIGIGHDSEASIAYSDYELFSSRYPTQEEQHEIQGDYSGILKVRGLDTDNSKMDNHMRFKNDIVTFHWKNAKMVDGEVCYTNGIIIARYYISKDGEIVVPFYGANRIILERNGNVLTGRLNNTYNRQFRFEKESNTAVKK